MLWHDLLPSPSSCGGVALSVVRQLITTGSDLKILYFKCSEGRLSVDSAKSSIYVPKGNISDLDLLAQSLISQLIGQIWDRDLAQEIPNLKRYGLSPEGLRSIMTGTASTDNILPLETLCLMIEELKYPQFVFVLDQIDAIKDINIPDLIASLERIARHARVIVSGACKPWLTPLIKNIPIVNADTEYKGESSGRQCIMRSLNDRRMFAVPKSRRRPSGSGWCN
jgi:hypothetical protein